MKKYAAFLISFVLLIHTSCSTVSKITTNYEWGNTTENINENGFIVSGDDKTFYCSEIGANYHLALYRFDNNEISEQLTLYPTMAYCISLVNNYLYFLDGLPGNICKINVDGSEFSILRRGMYSLLHVSKNVLIYRERSKLIIEGGGLDIRIDEVVDFVVYGDKVFYYSDSEKNCGIYLLNISDNSVQKITDMEPVSMGINSKYLFYAVGDLDNSLKDGVLYRFELTNNSEPDLVSTTLCWNMNVTEDFIFFRNQSAGGALCKMDLVDFSETLLVDGNCGYINLFNDYILFSIYTSGKYHNAGIYLINCDGTQLQLLQMRE